MKPKKITELRRHEETQSASLEKMSYDDHKNGNLLRFHSLVKFLFQQLHLIDQIEY